MSSFLSEHSPSQSLRYLIFISLYFYLVIPYSLERLVSTFPRRYYELVDYFILKSLVYISSYCISVVIEQILWLKVKNISLKRRYVSTKSFSFLPKHLFVPSILILTYNITMNPQEKFTQQLLANNLRPDGREPLEERKKSPLFLAQKGNHHPTKVISSSLKERQKLS